MAEEIFGGHGPGEPNGGLAFFTTTAGVDVFVNPAHVVRVTTKVPELTTTVLTMTLTGVAADSRLAGGANARIGRRGLAVAAMLAGALAGGVLALDVGVWAPLTAAVAVLLVVSVAAHLSDTTLEAAEAP